MATTKIKSGGITAAAVETAAIKDLNVTVAKLPSAVDISTKTVTLPASVGGLGTGITAAQLTSTLDLSTHTVTLPASAIPYPTISGISPTVITNATSTIVITGTNFGATGTPYVDLVSSAGAITPAASVTRNSATQITITTALSVDTTYYIRVELGSGLAVRTSSALLTVSDEPAWVTGSGSLGTFAGVGAISAITLTCTDATSFAVTTNAVTGGLTFTSGVGSATITGTQTAHSVAATDSFSVTATDAQAQTAVRAFTISWSFGATGGAQFN